MIKFDEMHPATTLTERAKFVHPFVHKILCDAGTFSKYLMKQFPITDGYRTFEPPFHGEENFIVVVGPSDLQSVN